MTLVAPKYTGAGGMARRVDLSAQTAGQAYNVIAVGKLPVMGMAHEIGHTMGAVHDWKTPGG